MISDDMSQIFLQNILKGQNVQQSEVLSRYHLIDLGCIQGYNTDGTVNVLSPYFMEGAPVAYEHVELLYIGTNAGCISFNPEGCLCLLLKPYSCIPDTTTMEIDNRESPHSNAGMKAIPVTNGRQTTLTTMFDGFGNFKMDGDGVSINMSPSITTLTMGNASMTFSNEGEVCKCLCNGQLFVTHSGDGTTRILRYDTNNIAQYMMKVEANGSYVIKRNATKAFSDADYDDLDAFTDWRWVETYNTDGSVSKVLQQDADTPLLTHSVDATGSVTETLSKDSGMKYTLNVGENVSIVIDGSAKSIAIKTGSVTNTQKDTAWSISVNGPITIESSTSDLIKIKNAASSLFTVINDIITVLNGGACATAGSPAAHTITAGQFSQALTDLQALTGA